MRIFKPSSDWDRRIGVLDTSLVLLAACIAGFHGVLEARDHLRSNDVVNVIETERRFRDARRILPPRGEVGYLGDAPVTDEFEDWYSLRRFVQVQYALVPLTVVPDVKRDWIVTNYEDGNREGVSPGPEYELVRDLGEGVLIFRRAVSPCP